MWLRVVSNSARGAFGIKGSLLVHYSLKGSRYNHSARRLAWSAPQRELLLPLHLAFCPTDRCQSCLALVECLLSAINGHSMRKRASEVYTQTLELEAERSDSCLHKRMHTITAMPLSHHMELSCATQTMPSQSRIYDCAVIFGYCSLAGPIFACSLFPVSLRSEQAG
jgi:hypothetical protein